MFHRFMFLVFLVFLVFLAFLAFLAFIAFDSRTCLTVLAWTVPAGVPTRL